MCNPHLSVQGAAPATWVPDSGAEDVGGSKAARRAGGSALALEAELNSLQRSMLTSWQPPLGAQQAPPPPPLGQQVPAWQAQLESLETRAAVRQYLLCAAVHLADFIAPRAVISGHV